MSEAIQDEPFAESQNELTFFEDDLLIFSDEELETNQPSRGTWKILVVDDESEIHSVTKLALNEFVFDERNLTFISAYSGEQAKQLIKSQPDIAIILLDVVMEKDGSVLDLVKYIRDVLNNKLVRIILRTGQPGQVPEDVVIMNYDINDYKTKTELTTQKLFTTTVAALRSFHTLTTLESSKKELERIALENIQLYQQLEEYSRTLEQKVIARTVELELKNQQLKQEIRDRQRAETALQKANQELQRLAILDFLTQVANRRRFDQYLFQEWQRLRREQKPLALIMCDVDYFKRYNDTYGHPSGDNCLQQVAQAISRAVKRPADLVARYGGEEFAVILPNTPTKAAGIVAEGIRSEIQRLQSPHTQSLVSSYVTLSMGVTSLVPTQKLGSEVLIAIVDKALYEAKQQGRDRAIVRTTSPPSEIATLGLPSLIE